MRDVNVRLYSTVYMNNLSYEEALERAKHGAFITRPEWNGFHYIENGMYKIMLKEGYILEEPKEIYGKEENDWCVVEITMEALKIILGEEEYK